MVRKVEKEQAEINDISIVFLITKEFQDSEEFSEYIETSASEAGLSLMEFLLEYCEQKDVDPVSIATIITPSLKKKIQGEAEELNLLKPPRKAR